MEVGMWECEEIARTPVPLAMRMDLAAKNSVD